MSRRTVLLAALGGGTAAVAGAIGVAALAAAVDPTVFTGSPCLAGDPQARVVVADR